MGATFLFSSTTNATPAKWPNPKSGSSSVTSPSTEKSLRLRKPLRQVLSYFSIARCSNLTSRTSTRSIERARPHKHCQWSSRERGPQYPRPPLGN
jgi:hypothetical protein